MPRFAMNTDPSTWPNTDDDKANAVMRAYVASGEFTTDALDWAGDHAHRHAALVDAICDYYAESPECHSALDDIADGVRRVA